MIEATYSAFISDHADSMLRERQFNAAEPPAGNVVPLAGRR
jgi:hypothetical protein